MGVWGTSLYANDCTCDVRDTYMDFLQKQMDKEEAYRRTLEECNQYIGDIDEPFFWYALADTQWRVGRLIPEVKERAIYWIEKNGGLELWTESKNRGEGWKKTLVKLKERLESPMPPEKRIKSISPFPRNPWNIGDIYVYQFHSETSKNIGLYEKYIPFQKIGDVEWCDGWILSRIQIYNKAFESIPTLDDLQEVCLLPVDNPEKTLNPNWDRAAFPIGMNAVLVRYNKRDYTEKYFTFIGNKADEFNKPLAAVNTSTYDWRNMEERWLCEYFALWQKREYENLLHSVI